MNGFLFSIQKKHFIFFLVLLMATTNFAHAKEKIPDQFRIALGGFAVVRYDSLMSLTEPNLGAGISISPEDTLGLSSEQAVLRLEGYYRFTKKHAMTYSWYRISSDGSKVLEEEFDWTDENGDTITIPIGAKVDSSLSYDIFKLGYLWSFHHTDKVEMAAGVGLHMTRIEIGLTTDTTSSGVDARDVDTTLPLPVVSFAIIYHVTPKFSWHFKQEFFVLQYDKWDGNYTDSTLGIEYRFLENVGLGVALSSNSLKVTENEDDYKFSYDNRISGVLINVAAYF
jgi:hypothetical protein